jgi:hypothetical protein
MKTDIIFTFVLETEGAKNETNANNTSHASDSSQDGHCATGRLLFFGKRDKTNRRMIPTGGGR